MARVKLKFDWDKTAALLALLMNIHRDPKKRAIEAGQLNPFREGSKYGNRVLITKDNIKQIGENFVNAGRGLQKK